MIVAGVGFRTVATANDILQIVRRAQRESRHEANGIAAPAFKAKHEGLLRAAEMLELPLIVLDADALEAVQSRCVTQSARVEKATRFASVAEACALAALDDRATLILPRIADARATCALALGARS